MTRTARRFLRQRWGVPIVGVIGYLLAVAGPARGTTPVDWNLTVNVKPLFPYVHPNSQDRIRVLISSDAPCGGVTFANEPPVLSGRTIRLQGHRFPPLFECYYSRLQEEVVLPPLPINPSFEPNVYRLELYDEELLIHSEELDVFRPRDGLWLVVGPAGPQGRGVAVSVRLTDPVAGPPRETAAVMDTPTSGHFWFFDPDNVEVTAKVVDGRPVNGRLWVFLTGMSNLGFTVTVRSCATCVRTYVNPPGERLNVIDTELP